MHRIVMALVLVTVAAPVSAQPLQAQLSRCVAIPGVLQRLACYDGVAKGAGIVAPAGSAPASAAAPAYRSQPAAPLPAPVATYVPPPPAGLGSERVQQAPQVTASRPQALMAQVSKVTFDPYGRFTMTFEDGQVWRQVAGDQTILRDPRVKTVRISRGALGSYDLTVMGHNASYKVTRLQ